MTLILASASSSRARLLQAAGLSFEVAPARVDEDGMKAALIADGAGPRDIADALAELKARKISEKKPEALVIGSDQILEIDGQILSKPVSPDAAKAQIKQLSGRTHKLLSAVVLYEDRRPVWRHVSVARMIMRDLSDAYIDDYVTRNWDEIRYSVGGYLIEAEGVRFFTRIEGDTFTIQGLPLLELLSYLTQREILTI